MAFGVSVGAVRKREPIGLEHERDGPRDDAGGHAGPAQTQVANRRLSAKGCSGTSCRRLAAADTSRDRARPCRAWRTRRTTTALGSCNRRDAVVAASLVSNDPRRADCDRGGRVGGRHDAGVARLSRFGRDPVIAGGRDDDDAGARGASTA